MTIKVEVPPDTVSHRMSASQVKSFYECPLQWYYKYISEEEPDPGEQKYLNLGLAVHEALEIALSFGVNNLEVESTLAEYEKQAEEYGVTEDLWETGESCIEQAVEYTLDQWPTLTGIEKRSMFDITSETLNTEVIAYMDVTTENEVWDWKTGSIRDNTAAKEKIQGAVYMAAFHAEFGHPPEAIRFIYLKEEELRTVDPNDDVWQFMLQYARSLLQAKQQGEFEATPGEHCFWCDFEHHCPASAVGMGGVIWEDWLI